MADLFYYESGYIDSGYTVYTADAGSAIASSSSMSCDAGKIVSSQSTMSSAFTQTTYASRTKDIDLYAFSEATIAIQVSVIRTNNVAASSVFDIATDGRRFRDVASADEVTFTFAGQAERSRVFTIETQAAFSITADGDVIGAPLDGQANLEVEASLSASVERILFNLSSLNSNTTLSTQVGKISETSIELDSVVDLTATISHIHGADLSAFSNATLSLVPEIIKETSSAFEIEFTENVDVLNILQLSSSIDCTTSLSSTLDGTLESTISLSSNCSIDITISRIRNVLSTIDSNVDQSTDSSRLRDFDSSQSVNSSLSAIISHIEGADLSAFSNATLSIETSNILSSTITLATTSDQVTSAIKNVNGSIQLHSYASVFCSKWMGYGRPWNVTYTDGPSTNVYGPVVSINNNYSALVNAGQDWVFDVSFSIYDTTAPYATWGTLRPTFSLGPLSNTGTTLSLVKSDGTTISRSDMTRPSISNDVLRITILKIGSTIQLFENGVNRGTLTSSGDVTWYRSATFKFNFNAYTVSGNNVSLNYAYFSIGNTYGLSTGSGTISDLARTNEVPTTRLNLTNVDSVFVDDTRILNQSGNASLSSTATITRAYLSGPTRASADLQSTFTQTTIGSASQGADLSAFSEAAVSVDVTRIRSTQSSQTIESSLSSTVIKLTESTITASSELNVDVDSVVTRDAVISTDAVASELVVVVKIGDFSIEADVVSTMSVTAYKTTDVVSNNESEFTQISEVVKITDVISSISSEVSLDADNSRTRDISSDFDSNVEQTTTGSKFVGFTVDLSSTFTVEAVTHGLIDIIALVMSAGTLEVDVHRTRTTSSSQSSEFTQTTNTFDSLAKQASANIASEFTQTAAANRIRDNQITTESIASELVAIGKIGQGLIVCESYVSMSITAQKTVAASSQQTAEANLSALSSKLVATANSVMSATTSMAAEGTTNIIAEASLITTGNLAVVSSRTRNVVSNLAVVSSIYCNTGRIRPFAELTVSAATLTSTIHRVRDSSANFTAFYTQLSIGDAVTGGEAHLSAAFGLTAIGREFNITKYVYKIGSETRFYKIHSEDRSKTIREETRIYKIRRT